MYASSFLIGNARLWLISTRDAGEVCQDWFALRDALEAVYGPRHSDKQNRLSLGFVVTGALSPISLSLTA